MSRWSDIILARRAAGGSDGPESTPWGPWNTAPSAAGIQVRVRRNRISREGEKELHAWSYEFRSELPRPVSFQYKVHAAREGPFDRLVRRVVPGEIVRGSVILSTSGPIWIDARLVE